MGLRGLCLILCLPFALSLTACGDNKHFVFEDAGIDSPASDAATDAPPDALNCTGAGQMICNGACIDTNTDNNNCGACGTSCGTGTCQNGMCCPVGQTNCGGTCVDLTASDTNCGACNNDCGGGTCQTDNGMTTCCPQGQTNCNGTCVDTETSEANCGACGTTCGGSDSCCGGDCIDTQSDNANCGTCGTTCDSTMGDTCKAGTPAACCGAGESNCSGTCSALTDDANCGACGASCNTGIGQGCKAAVVGTTQQVACCTASQNNCGGTCSDPMTDESNCGACGTSCDTGETCLSGICCGPGQTNCGGQCVDLLTDATHCGTCATTCMGGTPLCNGGTCASTCDPLEIECSGDCVNTSSDPNNCGGCGVQCNANQVCNGGSCTTMCDVGETNCNGACVNLTGNPGDPNHCGSCTTVCALGDECVSGTCQLDCPVGQQLCGTMCSDTKSDEMNCGGCAGGGGGVACGANQTCDDGICCGPGLENVDGICCAAGQINCGGTCVDPDSSAAHCGGCGQTCGAPSTCEDGECCGVGLDNCGGTCIDKQDNESHCGACNAACSANETCTAGICCDSLTEYNAGGICCALDEVNCNGVCTDLTDPTTCGTTCMNAGACQPGEVCDNGGCTVNCTGTETNCFGSCVETGSDENNCGACGNVCAAGTTCTGGVCGACPSTVPTECEPPINECVDPRDDGSNCGKCGQFCAGGEHCSPTTITIASATQSGFTATFTTSAAHFLLAGDEVIVSGMSVAGYNGAWMIAAVPTATTFTAVLPVQGLGAATGGSSSAAESGECCGFGLEACNGQCVNYETDQNNCGSCGNSCGSGSVCVDGACVCGFGQILCNGNCITPSVDPLNCGSCGNICGAPPNSGKDFCVSGGCVGACPAPLTGCGTGPTAECVNTDSDSDNCGSCGNKCLPVGGMETGCSAGVCVPTVDLGDPPAKCVGGGPPIQVPDDDGTICTGSLGATSFTFGLCSRTNIGPISRDLITDAFDSTSGPYVASCLSDPDCGPKRCRVSGQLCTVTADCPVLANNDCDFPVKCIGDRCAGGGIGVNGVDDGVNPPVQVGPVASVTATTHVGGSFWVFGTIGLAVKGATQVKQRFLNPGNLDLAKSTHVWGEAIVGGSWSSGGNTDMTIDKQLTVVSPTSCPPLGAGVLTLNGSPTACTQVQSFPAFAAPCGTRAQLIDVKKIVRHYAIAGNNDNALIGLDQTVLDNPATSLRIDLPCGVYYLNSINAGKSVTIVVHGRTALVIGGSIRISQKVIFDVQPNASLDIFAGGVLNVSNDTTLGSPAYPRLTRLYLGDDGCKGSGALLPGEDFTDCCSGQVALGACTSGGGNLSQTISLSQGGHFNGLLWGGYGTFTHSNPLEMYGSIFTNKFDASGDTIVHYDNGAVKLGDECGEPPEECESCRDCNNQACNGGQCGSCSADSDCCPPLVCNNGTCVLE